MLNVHLVPLEVGVVLVIPSLHLGWTNRREWLVIVVAGDALLGGILGAAAAAAGLEAEDVPTDDGGMRIASCGPRCRDRPQDSNLCAGAGADA